MYLCGRALHVPLEPCRVGGLQPLLSRRLSANGSRPLPPVAVDDESCGYHDGAHDDTRDDSMRVARVG